MANEIVKLDANALISVADNYLNNEAKGIALPPNYDYRNAVSTLYLQCVNLTTADGKPVLEVCTKESIINTVREMVLKGLNPAKKQCYPIPYAVRDKETKQVIRYELQLQESYFGRQKRAYTDNLDVVRNSINATCIYKGDVFEFKIINGRKVVTKHEQKFENMVDANIIGAYATVVFKDGTTKSEIMTTAEIKRSWAMSKAGGGVHANFTYEMCCKTVTSRLAKHLANVTDDAAEMGDYEDDKGIAGEVININDIDDADDEINTLPETTASTDMSDIATPTEESEPPVRKPAEKVDKLCCFKCGKAITQKIANYSIKNFGKPLCFNCQSSEGGDE